MLFYTIQQPCLGKKTIKKSSFTAFIIPVCSKEEVLAHIHSCKEKHKADHFPYAYRLASIKNDELCVQEYASDDGEPSKTAGLPLLNVLRKEELVNCLIVVARVFGGIKLGPAGLIKAFSESADLVIQEKSIFTPTKEIIVELPLRNLDAFVHVLEKEHIAYEKQFSGAIVKMTINLPLGKEKILEKIKN
jgi:putative IMPACT (imprinted ancient) family translation regulator